MNHNLTNLAFSPSYTKEKNMSIALQLTIINHGAPQKLTKITITSTENTNIATLKPELEPIGQNFTRIVFSPSHTEEKCMITALQLNIIDHGECVNGVEMLCYCWYAMRTNLSARVRSCRTSTFRRCTPIFDWSE